MGGGRPRGSGDGCGAAEGGTLEGVLMDKTSGMEVKIREGKILLFSFFWGGGTFSLHIFKTDRKEKNLRSEIKNINLPYFLNK